MSGEHSTGNGEECTMPIDRGVRSPFSVTWWSGERSRPYAMRLHPMPADGIGRDNITKAASLDVAALSPAWPPHLARGLSKAGVAPAGMRAAAARLPSSSIRGAGNKACADPALRVAIYWTGKRSLLERLPRSFGACNDFSQGGPTAVSPLPPQPQRHRLSHHPYDGALP